MRVKTAPRQRFIHGHRNESEILIGKLEKVRRKEVSNDAENASVRSEKPDGMEKTKEEPNYNCEALDMSIKHKREICQNDSIAGPSNSEHPEENQQEIPCSDDFNNNKLNCCIHAGPSIDHDSRSCGEDESTSSSDDEEPTEAVNLCKKDNLEEDASKLDDRQKDTFLYKIMTDPTFLENIQKHKQLKRHVCQFCKQEFLNGDELADHMDVKKDESNQVACCACKKTFAQKRYLRYHQRCHDVRMKFTCDVCTKKYTRLDNLIRHNACHVNPDKFSCTYCEKTFARKDLLNKHLTCHVNKYRFFCEICQKFFKGALSLDNHKKIVHSVT